MPLPAAVGTLRIEWGPAERAVHKGLGKAWMCRVFTVQGGSAEGVHGGVGGQ